MTMYNMESRMNKRREIGDQKYTLSLCNGQIEPRTPNHHSPFALLGLGSFITFSRNPSNRLSDPSDEESSVPSPELSSSSDSKAYMN